MKPEEVASLIRWHKAEIQHCSQGYTNALAKNARESRRWLSRLRNHSRTLTALEEYLNVQVQPR